MEAIQDYPFERLSPVDLIGANTFYDISSEQIIFYFEPWNDFVITTIREDSLYSIHAYEALPVGAPYQFFQNKLIYMPAPKPIHQTVSQNINRQLDGYVHEHKLGKVLYAPVDVQFDENNVLQPDLLYISLSRKGIYRNDKPIQGAPDFIIEILSSNAFHDRLHKMDMYAEHDVMEYWVVDIEEQCIEAYQNVDKVMELRQKANAGERLASKVIEGFEIDVDSAFELDGLGW